MGARPEQQLTLNFLRAIHNLWVEFPGEYVVEESADDLIPALAQTCIKALAADVRDGSPGASQREIVIDGRLVNLDGSEDVLDLRQLVNKIIHGTPTRVVVEGGNVYLHFRNNTPRNSGNDWSEAWFSGTQLLGELDRRLYKHPAGSREDEIAGLLRSLGAKRFLPTRMAGGAERRQIS